MMMRRIGGWLVFLALITSLGACGGGTGELKKELDERRKRQGTQPEPLPQIKSYESFQYDPTGLRSPFQPSIPQTANNSNGPRPDAHRSREFLENYPLDTLKLDGICLLTHTDKRHLGHPDEDELYAELDKRTKGALGAEVYPNSSLVKTVAQYSAIRKGALDMTLYPLNYAGGEVGEVVADELARARAPRHREVAVALHLDVELGHRQAGLAPGDQLGRLRDDDRRQAL